MTWYDEGMPMINDADVMATAVLIKRLYAMPGCDMGGPLHAMLDDGNIDDTQVESDYYDATDGRTIETYLCRHRMVQVGTAWHHVYDDVLYPPPEVADLARLILASMRRMPSSWRAAAIAWADGTIAHNAVHINPEWVLASEASPEQVDALIADLRQETERGNNPPEPQACTPIPCPPFVPFPAIQGVEQVHYEQSIDYPGVRVTKLDCDGNPVGEPILVAGWAEAGFQISPLKTGEVKPTLKWVETTIRLADGITPDLWQALYGWEWPTFDLEQVRNEPPQVDVATPTFVDLPEGVTADQMMAAIELCRRAGLLDSPAGYVLFPSGMSRP